ncbi:hypothetical protein B4113_0334 [Geobacillus sp. B4113_201601]|nr:hypothetical protein B4113_0334 [Geobacillus sp. B4113_201601]
MDNLLIVYLFFYLSIKPFLSNYCYTVIFINNFDKNIFFELILYFFV